MPLSEQWPWNPAFLRLMLVVPTLLGIIAAASCYPAAGPAALWFLTAPLAGILMNIIYGAVGSRVLKLTGAHRNEPGEVIESLLVIGGIQSPGIAILRTEEIQLIPIAGEPCTIPFRSITGIREGSMLPGRCLLGKRAFTLQTTLNKRLAFAIRKSAAPRWSQALDDAVTR